MRRANRLTAALLLTALPLLAACGEDEGKKTAAPGATTSPSPTPAPTVPELAITGVDYGFQVTGTVSAGLTKISFTNAGKEEHMTGLGKLQPGKTLGDVQAALKSQDEKAFGAVFDEKEGDKDAPQVMSPGYTATTYTQLTEGTYALICFIPSPDGKSHYDKGMLSTVNVGPAASAPAAPAPTAAVELVFKGGKLTGPATLPAGKTVFKVTTDANHELFGVVGLNGKSVDQVSAYFDAKFSGKAPSGPPHGAIVLGLHDFEVGEEILFELDLKPGPVGFICELENDGAKAHNEKLVITVT